MTARLPLAPETRLTPTAGFRRGSRRGSILIIAMWILVALVGVALVMGRWARVESMAAVNRVAAVQAATATRAAEQYVISQVEQAAGDATFVAQSPAEAVPVGPDPAQPVAYFWVMRPDREDDQRQDFAIDDEGSKININTANRDTLMKLPGLTADIADAIIDWRDADENPSAGGAESDYYQTLQPPYRCKNGPFESVEELLLVKGVTPDLLYGIDTNHNGFLEEEEVAAAGTSVQPSQEGSPSPRGLLPFVSVYGVGTPAATGTGATPAPGGGGQQGGNNQANPGLVNVNTASREVLRCLAGLEDAEAMALVAARDTGVDTTSTAWVSSVVSRQKLNALNAAITAKSYRYSADVVGVSADGRAFHRVRIVVDGSKSPPAVAYRRDLSGAGWPLGPEVRAEVRSGALLAGSGGSRTVRSTAR